MNAASTFSSPFLSPMAGRPTALIGGTGFSAPRAVAVPKRLQIQKRDAPLTLRFRRSGEIIELIELQ
jgi:hypothetical protein